MTMLERETEIIRRAVIDKTIGTRGSISVHDVLAADIPAGVKAYLQAEVTSWLRRDLESSPRIRQAEASSPSIASLTRAYIRSLSEAYVLSREECVATLDDAVHFVGNYLCRPQWTLEHFIFEKRERVSGATLLGLLEYTSDYGYFRRLFEKMIRAKHWEEIGASDFHHLIARIDEQVVAQHDAGELASLMRPIFDFVLPANEPGNGAVAVKPILLFLEDKQLTILREYIESVCRIRGIERATFEEIAGMINDVYVSRRSGTTLQPPSEPPIAPAPEIAPPPEAVPAQPVMPEPIAPETENIPAQADTPAPAPENPPVAGESAAPPPAEEAPAPHPQQTNIALSLTFAGMVGTPPPLSDLYELIPKDQQARFVKKLFRRDDDYFGQVIDGLNKIRTWKDSTIYLQQLYELNELDPFADEVVELTNAVQKRFELRGDL